MFFLDVKFTIYCPKRRINKEKKVVVMKMLNRWPAGKDLFGNKYSKGRVELENINTNYLT